MVKKKEDNIVRKIIRPTGNMGRVIIPSHMRGKTLMLFVLNRDDDFKEGTLTSNEGVMIKKIKNTNKRVYIYVSREHVGKDMIMCLLDCPSDD